MQKYKVGDLVALGGKDNRPSRLVISVTDTAIGYIPIHWVSNGMPNVVDSGIGQVVGNVMDFIPQQKPVYNNPPLYK